MTGPGDIILASASTVRRALLSAAGIDFTVEPSRVDEAIVKESLAGEGASADHVAEVLAEMKAVKISSRFPEAIVIGADQVLHCEGRHFDKPETMDEAKSHLQALAGKTHILSTATVIARGGSAIWRHIERPKLTMRPMPDGAIDGYLARAGDGVLASVGAYQIEAFGVHLFARIEGDHYAIMGLPMLPLLQFLRDHGALDL
ncbi:MAG: Maf family protein [Pseudomonadota bacterium]